MAKSPAEQIRELSVDVSVLESRTNNLLNELNEQKAADLKRQDEIADLHRKIIPDLRQEVAALRQENAILRQQLQDHVAQYQEWDRRRWGLIVMLIGTVLSLAGGLIATLSRR